MASTAVVTLDSTQIHPGAMAEIENILYGRNGQSPRLPLPAEIIAICKSYEEPPAPVLVDTITEDSSDQGIFSIATSGLTADPSDEGTFLISRGGLVEDPSDPGTYLIGKS